MNNRVFKAWDNALKSDMSVFDIALLIDWGFDDDALATLKEFHKTGKYREKIEALLTECNFHDECTMWHNGDYDPVPLF